MEIIRSVLVPSTFLVAVAAIMLMPQDLFAVDTSLRIQDNLGKEITKERLFSAVLTGAWQLGKPEACKELTKRLSQPGDFSAYDVQCNLGNVVEVKAIQALPDGFLLKASIDRSHIKANFTQPTVAGKWADPSADIYWDSAFEVIVKYTGEGQCPGIPGNLPWLRFDRATFQALSPEVDIHSTVADIVGAITGFFGGFLFGGTGSIPMAIAGAYGTSAIVDGVAQAHVSQAAQNRMEFTKQLNNELEKVIGPCDLVKSFGSLVGVFQTKSLTLNLVTLSAKNAVIPNANNACVSSPIINGFAALGAAWNDHGSASIAVFLGDGKKFLPHAQWSTRDGGWGDSVKWVAADFTGDGRTDIGAIWNNGGSNTLTVRQSTGSGFSHSHWATNAGGWMDSSIWLPGDFNGDGLIDLAAVWNDHSSVTISVFPGDGKKFLPHAQWSTRDGGWGDSVKWVAADFTGDGRTDIGAIWNNGGSNTLTVRQSTGSGFSHSHWATNAGGWMDSSAWCVGVFQ